VVPRFKASKDHILLLGGNASGNYKIKPVMVYHSENTQELMGYSEGVLPGVWRSHKKAWIMSGLF
jgi:hypothetical protein